MKNIWYGYENEPYKSKTKKRKTKKSDHKHIYKPCYVKYQTSKDEYIHKAEYCVLCNKVTNYTLYYLSEKQIDQSLPIFIIYPY